jgi:hypothetical protein
MKLDAAGHERNRACSLFSGHPADDASALRQGHHAHIFLAAPPDAEGVLRRLYVMAPWRVDRSVGAAELQEREARHFARVVARLQYLHGGELADKVLVSLMPVAATVDPLVAAARRWHSLSLYCTTRHHRAGRDGEPSDFLRQDLLREMARRGLPEPCAIHIDELRRRGERLEAMLELVFTHAFDGPLLLGHGSHAGRGLFIGAGERRADVG